MLAGDGEKSALLGRGVGFLFLSSIASSENNFAISPGCRMCIAPVHLLAFAFASVFARDRTS